MRVNSHQLSSSFGPGLKGSEKTVIDLQIGHAMFIPRSSSYSSTEHVAIATQDTVSIIAPGKGSLLTLDHVIGGKLSCMDCTADRLALGVGSYGYGTLGNKVIYCKMPLVSSPILRNLPDYQCFK